MYSDRVYICSIPTFSLRPLSSAKSLSSEASHPSSTRVGNGSAHASFCRPGEELFGGEVRIQCGQVGKVPIVVAQKVPKS